MSRPTLALAGHSLRRVRALLAVMMAVLFVFQVLVVLMAATLQELGTFERIAALIPAFVRQFLGPSLIGVFTFPGIASVGYFHVVVVAWLVGFAIAVGSDPAAEVERGFLDLVLSRAVPRHVVMTRTLLVLVWSTGVSVAVMVAGTGVGLAAAAPPGATWPAPSLIASLAVNLWAVVLCWGGIATAVAARARRRASAASVTAVAAFSLFLIDYIARAWAPARPLARFSPFHYYNGMELVAGAPLPASHLAVLLGTAAAAFGVAYVLFSHRDI